jgi:glycosyltransferase involved in cell wall biosynthesis
MDKLYIVIPAYNEELNIKRCVEEWYPIVEAHNESGESRLVIVNDGSRDNTSEILNELSQEKTLLVTLNKENGGHGSALLYGYKYAIKQDADWIFQTDSDGQTNPNEFEGFWEKRNDFDAVIGERHDRGDGAGRKFVEDVVCILLRLGFRVSAKDANAPFRLMKTDLVGRYIDRLPIDFNIPNIMFVAYFLYYKENVTFSPITFKPRTAGKASINLKKIIKIGIKAVGDFYRLRKEM